MKEIKHVGQLSGYEDVWFKASIVVNILSLGRVTSRFRVTFDSSVRRVGCLPSRWSHRALLSIATRTARLADTLHRRRDVVLMIATVAGNKRRFTKREVRDAERASRLQKTLMFPNDRILKTIPESLCD